MAKKKSDDAADDIKPLDHDDTGGVAIASVDVTASVDEMMASKLAALQAENEALKAKLAARDAAADLGTLPAGDPDPSWPTFLVKSQHAPSWVVRAPNVGLAPEAWRRATGVIATPYPIEVMPAPDLTPGRFLES